MVANTPPPVADERFPGFEPSEYIRGVLDGCDREQGYVSIIGVGKFYISPIGNMMWTVIRRMVESDMEYGYASLSDLRGWQNSFTSRHGAVPPKDSGHKFVGGQLEFFQYIHGYGRTGRFRIKKRPK